jgi:DNA-binding IclR family transcriptional regulator
MREQAANPVEAVRRTFRIIEELKRRNGATVTNVAAGVDLPTSTVHNHLSTLRELDYVVRAGDEYELSPRFVHVGDQIKQQREIYRVGRSTIDYLAESSGEVANLMVELNGRGIYLATAWGEQGMRNFASVRERDYLHSTASGKAILASLPAARVDAVLEEWGLPAVTENTITGREELEAELAEAEDRGYALNDRENTPGVRAVAAPVDRGDGSYAAVSVSGPATRLDDDRFRSELPGLVRDAAKAIEADLPR